MTPVQSPLPREVGEIFYRNAADQTSQLALFYAPETQMGVGQAE